MTIGPGSGDSGGVGGSKSQGSMLMVGWCVFLSWYTHILSITIAALVSQYILCSLLTHGCSEGQCLAYEPGFDIGCRLRCMLP